jgi:hypothetical protein
LQWFEGANYEIWGIWGVGEWELGVDELLTILRSKIIGMILIYIYYKPMVQIRIAWVLISTTPPTVIGNLLLYIKIFSLFG